MDSQFLGGETRAFAELANDEYETPQETVTEQMNETSEKSDIVHGRNTTAPLALVAAEKGEVTGGFPLAATAAALAPIVIPKLVNAVIPLAKKIVGKIGKKIRERRAAAGSGAEGNELDRELIALSSLPKGMIKKIAMPHEYEISTRARTGGFLGGKDFWKNVGKKALKVVKQVAEQVGPIALKMATDLGTMYIGKKLGGVEGLNYLSGKQTKVTPPKQSTSAATKGKGAAKYAAKTGRKLQLGDIIYSIVAPLVRKVADGTGVDPERIILESLDNDSDMLIDVDGDEVSGLGGIYGKLAQILPQVAESMSNSRFIPKRNGDMRDAIMRLGHKVSNHFGNLLRYDKVRGIGAMPAIHSISAASSADKKALKKEAKKMAKKYMKKRGLKGGRISLKKLKKERKRFAKKGFAGKGVMFDPSGGAPAPGMPVDKATKIVIKRIKKMEKRAKKGGRLVRSAYNPLEYVEKSGAGHFEGYYCSTDDEETGESSDGDKFVDMYERRKQKLGGRYGQPFGAGYGNPYGGYGQPYGSGYPGRKNALMAPVQKHHYLGRRPMLIQ